MYCAKCGTELREGAAYCERCGRRVEPQNTGGGANPSEPVTENRKRDIPSQLLLEKIGVPKWFMMTGIVGIVMGLFFIIPNGIVFFKCAAMSRFYRNDSLMWQCGLTCFLGVLLLIMGILWVKAPLAMKNNKVKIFTDKVQLECVDSPVAFNQVFKQALIGGGSRSINAIVMIDEISSVSCAKIGAIRFLEIETKGGNKYKVLINDAEELVSRINQCMHMN